MTSTCPLFSITSDTYCLKQARFVVIDLFRIKPCRHKEIVHLIPTQQRFKIQFARQNKYLRQRLELMNFDKVLWWVGCQPIPPTLLLFPGLGPAVEVIKWTTTGGVGTKQYTKHNNGTKENK